MVSSSRTIVVKFHKVERCLGLSFFTIYINFNYQHKHFKTAKYWGAQSTISDQCKRLVKKVDPTLGKPSPARKQGPLSCGGSVIWGHSFIGFIREAQRIIVSGEASLIYALYGCKDKYVYYLWVSQGSFKNILLNFLEFRVKAVKVYSLEFSDNFVSQRLKWNPGIFDFYTYIFFFKSSSGPPPLPSPTFMVRPLNSTSFSLGNKTFFSDS